MNSDLSLNVLTNFLSLLNHVYELDGVTKCPVHEFHSAWQRLQALVSQHTGNSLVSSLAVQTMAVVIQHGPQSVISQSVQNTVLSCLIFVTDRIMKAG